MLGSVLHPVQERMLRKVLKTYTKALWRRRSMWKTAKSELNKKETLCVEHEKWLLVFSKKDFDEAFGSDVPWPSFKESDDATYRKFDPFKSGNPVLLKYRAGSTKGRCLAVRKDFGLTGHKCKIKHWRDIAQTGPATLWLEEKDLHPFQVSAYSKASGF